MKEIEAKLSGDRVVVVKGKYRGITGKVVSWVPFPYSYIVSLDNGIVGLYYSEEITKTEKQ